MFRITSICLIIFFLGLMSACITHAEFYSFVSQNKNTGTLEMDKIAVDSSGNMYALDAHDNCVNKFDSKGNFITKWGSMGTSNGQFFLPNDIAVDSSGNIYVTDSGNGRIEKFDSKGAFITQLGSNGTGNGNSSTPDELVESNGFYFHSDPNGTGNGNISNSSGIVVDSSGNIYIADSKNNRIEKYDSNGIFITQWSINGICGIAIDSKDNIYVGNSADDYCIDKFDNNGKLITEIRSQGNTTGSLFIPAHIAVDSKGYIYTAGSNDFIQMFDSNGNFVTQLGFQGNSGNYAYDQFYGITDLAVDRSDTVYVCDVMGGVRKFSINYNDLPTLPISSTPVANFNSNVTKGNAPFTVQFTDSSKNAQVWYWNFGDGAISPDQNPTHTYTTAGTYNVELTASNVKGDNSKTGTIYVQQAVSSNNGDSLNNSVINNGNISSNNGDSLNNSVTSNGNTTNYPEQTSTTNNTTASKKSPGFEIVAGITTLSAAFLYKRK